MIHGMLYGISVELPDLWGRPQSRFRLSKAEVESLGVEDETGGSRLRSR